MSPATRARIDAALTLLEANGQCALRNDKAAMNARIALAEMGARFGSGNGHTMRFAGITGSCTWHRGGPLLRSWRDNARRKLAKLEGQTEADW